MPKFNSRYRGGGFTLAEVLIAVAVLAVLAGLAIPGVIRYQRLLQMQMLDHNAQEIFQAAQNRMTARKNAGTIATLAATTEDGVVYLTQASADSLLPDGALEAQLAGNYFYITYDPASGSVVSVFYSEAAFPYADGVRAKEMSGEERRRAGLWVGRYTGAPGGGDVVVQLPTPSIEMINREKLIANITVIDLPRTVPVGELRLELFINGKKITPPVKETALGATGRRYQVILDSLDPTEVHFQELGSDVTPGEDFILSARMTSTLEAVRPSGSSTQGANSLFQAVTGGGTLAEIAYGRHLQNLDQAVSNVTEKITQARQTSNLRFEQTEASDDWYSYYTKRGVGYRPVTNPALTSYDGFGNTITALTVEGVQNAGMFAIARGELKDIYLVNPKITGAQLAGTLAADAPRGLRIRGCRVYHADTDTSIQEDLVGNGYRVKAPVAGGLVGRFSGSLEILNSLAATLISDDDRGGTVGGLVGTGTGALIISGSYADCYLSGGTVGGLVGMTTASSRFTYSYCAGFVVKAKTAAGFGMTTGAPSVGDTSYSALVYLEADTIYSLMNVGTTTGCYYLSAVGVNNACGATEQSSSQLMELTKGLAGGTDWWAKQFHAATGATSNPYNLMKDMALTLYPFPKLKELPHHGDWRTEFQSGALVYYEEYAGESYGFSGGELNQLQSNHPLADGFAIAFEKVPGDATTVTYGGNSYSVDTKTPKEVQATVNGKAVTYYLCLPEKAFMEAVTAAEAAPVDFYQAISSKIGGGESTQYWFNPYFAATVSKSAGETTPPEVTSSVRIRTPRHLYALSRYARQYASRGWRFVQELPLDYAAYEWEKAGFGGTIVEQGPIGPSADHPFRGIYDGGGHAVANLSIRTDGSYLGLFGYNTGTLREVIFGANATMTHTGAITGRHMTAYAGGLVAYNTGTISDSAAAGSRVVSGQTVTPGPRFNLGNSTQSTLYLGGLVGRNEGIIRRCEAASEELNLLAVYANAYVGGFAGENGGTITQSAAQGALRVTRDTTGTVRAGGFAGGNTGTIGSSYCAVGLYAGGGATVAAFCPDTVGGSNYYLTNGNYTYRDGADAYSLTYSDDSGALGCNQLELSQQDIPGMTVQTPGPDGSMDDQLQNPYPAPLGEHYGNWLKVLSVGELGVCYWEKEERAQGAEYHFSYVSASVGGVPSVSKSLLCTYHDDGGVITEYGYAYYYRNATIGQAEVVTTGTYPTEILTTDRWERDQAINEKAAEAIRGQMGTAYTVVAYDTYAPQADGTEGVGLRPRYAYQNGLFPIRADGTTHYYRINPFFAESIDYIGTTYQGPAAHMDTLGKQGNPYGVRSIRQLQFINWDAGALRADMDSDLPHRDEATRFPYLLGSKHTGTAGFPNLSWVQSHDLQGAQVKAFQPIGSHRRPFAGSYDGTDYVIEDLTISSGSRFVGLFGVTKGATLKNIVMHSDDKTAMVKSTYSGLFYPYNPEVKVVNFSGVGGLVGLAQLSFPKEGDSGGGVGAINNCAISGYEIVNHVTEVYHDGDRSGSAAGGLAGWSEVNITACSAVTFVHGGGEVKGSNARILKFAGLVGASRVSDIRNCYAGGEIRSEVRGKPNEMFHSYINGMVGPDGDPHGNQTLLNNRIYSSYSYVKITQNAGVDPVHKQVRHFVRPIVYGQANTSYYLQEMVTATEFTRNEEQDKDKDNFPLTYDQFRDKTTQDGLLQRLNGNGGTFATVTTVENGVEVDGKYSYPSDRKLIGLNYPFPTVLKQNGANVHYGDWPAKGFVRLEPLELDLVAVRADAVPERETVVQLEFTPELAATVGQDGQYSVSVAPEAEGAIIAAAVSQAGVLTVTGLREGLTYVTVDYENKDDGTTYQLVVEVAVTAEVAVVVDPATAQATVGDEMTFACMATDRNANPLAAVQWRLVQSNIPEVADVKTGINTLGRFTAQAKAEGDVVFTVEAVYPDPLNPENTYSGTGRASLTVLPAVVSAKPVIMLSGTSYVYPAGDISITIQGGVGENVTVVDGYTSNEALVTVEQTGGRVTLVGHKPGTATVNLTVSYDHQGRSYTAVVPVEVTVLADQVPKLALALSRDRLVLAPGASIQLPLEVALKNTALQDLIFIRQVRVNGGTLASAVWDGNQLTVAAGAVEGTGKLEIIVDYQINTQPEAVQGSASATVDLTVAGQELNFDQIKEGEYAVVLNGADVKFDIRIPNAASNGVSIAPATDRITAAQSWNDNKLWNITVKSDCPKGTYVVTVHGPNENKNYTVTLYVEDGTTPLTMTLSD